MAIITPGVLNDGQITEALILDGEVTQPKLATNIDVSHFINDAGYISDITAESIFDLNNVSAPFGTADNYILVWNTAAGGFVATPITTDQLTEGTTNLYFTNTRAVDAVEGAGDIELSGKLFVNEDPNITLNLGGYQGAWNNAGFKVSANRPGPPAYFVRNIDTTAFDPTAWGSNIYGLRYNLDLTGANLDGSTLVVAHQIGDQSNMHDLFSYAAAIKNTTISSGVIDSFDGSLKFVVFDKSSGSSSTGTDAMTLETGSIKLLHNTEIQGELYLTGLNTSIPTGTSDTSGQVGEVRFGFDGSNFYMYVKTAAGWIRSQFNTW